MQTLEERNTYTPTDAPQVRSNCDPVLNKDPMMQAIVSRSQCIGFKNIF